MILGKLSGEPTVTCVHLQQLVQLCHDSDLRLSSSDLIHLVCKQCGKQDVCPSNLVEQFDEDEASEQPVQLPFAPTKDASS